MSSAVLSSDLTSALVSEPATFAADDDDTWGDAVPAPAADKAWLSIWQRDVLKSSFAYALATCFTFVDPLASLLSNSVADSEGQRLPNAHFAATAAVCA